MWEYITIDVPKDKQMLTDLLAVKQADGWELVTLYERIQPVVAIGGTVLVGVFRKYKPVMTVELGDGDAVSLWDSINQFILNGAPTIRATIQEPHQ